MPGDGIPEVATTTLPTPSDEVCAKVVAQVKHYFSDANLNHDEFMRKGLERGEEGWLPMDTLARFNKLRDLMGVPGKSAPAAAKGRGKQKKPRIEPPPKGFAELLGKTVRDGLKEDDAVEVREDFSAIRRKEKYVPSDAWFGTTVHVKGMEYGKEEFDVIDELTQLFGDLGEVRLVRLRRNPRTRAFKGNALVEFDSAEKAEEVSKRDDVQFKGQTLELAMLAQYHDQKIEAGEFIQPELRRPGATYPTYEEWCKEKGRPVPPPLDAPAAKAPKAPELPAIDDNAEQLVRFSGGNGDWSVAQLKEVAKPALDIKFVECGEGDGTASGILRLAEPCAAQLIADNPEGVRIGDDVVLELSAVSEDDAKAFFQRAQQQQANKKRTQGGGGRRTKRHRK
ncbi:hypothetical protein GGF46_005228 [Coemansia sp. RSA 552]|nr:hypothetical protein GGF46_005228 [Coemansia sp. RSA 552]